MKVLTITSAYSGFFPRFYELLRKAMGEEKIESFVLLPQNSNNRKAIVHNKVLWGTRFNWFIHYNLYRLTGLQDVFSFLETVLLLVKINIIKPSVVHLHMVNVWCINFPLFIWYVNKCKIPVVWTMHDCRAFTGRCAYFDEIDCNKWLTGCKGCKQNILYNPTVFHNEHIQWVLRKRMFNKFCNLTIVTPSKWLANLLEKSFIKNATIKVINNGIDIKSFSKDIHCELKKKMGISGKKMVLGIAANWEVRKGLDYFVFLSNRLPNDKYQVVLVGNIPDESDKKYEKIIQIPQTSSLSNIVEIYQSADVFVNPTLADNFPTTNIEALASGTPVVTFKTGGSAEAIDNTCGCAVEKGDKEALLNAVITVLNDEKINKDTCRKRAAMFSQNRYKEYVALYRDIIG